MNIKLTLTYSLILVHDSQLWKQTVQNVNVKKWNTLCSHIENNQSIALFVAASECTSQLQRYARIK